MRNRTRSPASLWAWLITLFVALVLGGCSTIKLVGDYDEQIDKGVTQLQKDVETFLVKLEATAQKPADKVENYDKNTKFYEDSKVALSGLRVRADAMERNSITVRMLDRLSKNIGRLEEMHQEGGALNSQFTAILTFELAKKRGEKIDDSRAQSPSTPKSTVEGDKK